MKNEIVTRVQPRENGLKWKRKPENEEIMHEKRELKTAAEEEVRESKEELIALFAVGSLAFGGYMQVKELRRLEEAKAANDSKVRNDAA